MQITSTLRSPLRPVVPKLAETSQPSVPNSADKVQFSVDGPTVAKSALAAAAYGALVGGASAYVYGSTDIGSATAIHMTAILGGGALGAGVLSHAIDHQFEKPSNYAMGALLGAGVTWGTSALGMLGRPVVGAVAGAMAGAFYGAMGGVFFGSKPE
ncbi:MAG: hypothetical protein KC800_27215 [Candidatus Eremiobacteraeota bacterium]|nr:hypothetical protein [Candidatus Eremiobacteraeota bacterium]